MIKTTIDPPLAAWRLRPANRERPVIATGHQAWLWHPGILAKDIAMAAAATRFGGDMFHLVVDQDTNAALRLELPAERHGELFIEVHQLAPENTAIPAASRPPVAPDEVIERLRFAQKRDGRTLLADLRPLMDAWRDLPRVSSLAQQLGEVTSRLMRPLIGEIPLVYATRLGEEARFRELAARLLDDARKSAACYNRAVARHAAARVAPLAEELERVEVPLWAISPAGPRLPVFADLADAKPIFVLDNGAPVPASHRLVPRALLMTAYLRSGRCDLFIHGKGGGVYDRITEEWWREWTGEELASMAVVSADVRLDFDVPLAEPAEVERAVWWRHHVRHNVDRAVKADGPLVARKREILEHMDDDRDPRRRAALFGELHRTNRLLAEAHPEVIADADRAVDRAKTGLINRQIAMKRDWFFGLYPPEKLEALRRAIAGSAEASQLPGAGGVQSATP